jgi:DNA transformation protein and related proteins
LSAGGIDPDHISELFSAFGPVVVRRMFGGAGIFADGVMFGLIEGGVIYLKADAATIPTFEREGSVPFSYATKRGMHTISSYWRLPDRLYDEPEELARWAAAALTVARAGAAGKRSKLPHAPDAVG